MPSSMTGFGRFEGANENAKITVEIRSVNHRYLDLNLKLNHRLLSFESKIRSLISEYLKRGKVDVSISYHQISGVGEDILYNESLAKLYVDRISKIATDFGLVNDITPTRLATFRDVLTVEEVDVDEDELWILVKEGVENALLKLVSLRNSEGERLKEDLLSKLDELSSYADFIEERAPKIIEEYKSRLLEKINGLLEDKDAEFSRVATEVVIYADKICVDEEIVRLNSHIKAFKDALNSKGEQGRKLDFIAQEMNRESNTILSKTTDPEVSGIGIEIKTLIEKIREQVQNIE